MKRIVINRFDGGIVNDPRDKAENVCQLSSHFDIYTSPFALTPYRNAETGDSSVADNNIANYAYDGTTVYGLGIATGTPIPKIFVRTNFTDATWTADAGGYTISGANRADQDIPFFMYYRKTGKLYGVRNGSHIYSVVPGTSASIEDEAITYTNVTNGIVHSKDDNLYFGYHDSAGKTSYIAKNDNDTWTLQALTLPSNLIPVSICEYGNYLAIACRQLGGLRSVVYLWDRDTSLATLSDLIDWGEGNIAVLEELAGYLIGVSFVGTVGSYSFKGRTIFRAYAGAGGARQFAELTGFSQAPAIGGGLSTGLGCFKQKVRNRILFSASPSIGTSGYSGIWSIGINGLGSFSVTREYALLNTASAVYGFILLGDYLFVSYINSSTWYMDKTNDAETYTTASVYQSTKNPGMPETDRFLKKKLVSVSVLHEAIPSSGEVKLEYKTDDDSYSTVITNSTAASRFSEMSALSAGTQFTDGREFEFRISSKGATVTALVYKYEILNTLI